MTVLYKERKKTKGKRKMKEEKTKKKRRPSTKREREKKTIFMRIVTMYISRIIVTTMGVYTFLT